MEGDREGDREGEEVRKTGMDLEAIHGLKIVDDDDSRESREDLFSGGEKNDADDTSVEAGNDSQDVDDNSVEAGDDSETVGAFVDSDIAVVDRHDSPVMTVGGSTNQEALKNLGPGHDNEVMIVGGSTNQEALKDLGPSDDNQNLGNLVIRGGSLWTISDSYDLMHHVARLRKDGKQGRQLWDEVHKCFPTKLRKQCQDRHVKLMARSATAAPSNPTSRSNSTPAQPVAPPPPHGQTPPTGDVVTHQKLDCLTSLLQAVLKEIKERLPPAQGQVSELPHEEQ